MRLRQRKISMTVTFHRTADADDVACYIQDALMFWGRQLHPNDDMFTGIEVDMFKFGHRRYYFKDGVFSKIEEQRRGGPWVTIYEDPKLKETKK